MDSVMVPFYIAVSLSIVVLIAGKIYIRINSNIEKPAKIKAYPIDERNKEKEKELLASLLQDIKANTYEWMYTVYNPSSMAASSIINDVKNIAIIVGQNSMLRTATTIVISYGIKDIAKYNTHSTDNVCTHIQGKHVTDFCINVEDCLDTRGHELDHFKEQIKSKL